MMGNWQSPNRPFETGPLLTHTASMCSIPPGGAMVHLEMATHLINNQQSR